jgi:hypothetical protein
MGDMRLPLCPGRWRLSVSRGGDGPGPICPRAGASCNMAGNEWPSSIVASRTARPTEIRRPTVEHRTRYVIRRVRVTMPQPFANRKIAGLRGRRAFAREGRSANASSDISSILQAVPSPRELEGPQMPLKRLLDESRAFGPKAVAILLEAFDAVVAELDLRTNAEKERAAKIIIRLALGQKDLDAAKLRESAIIAVPKESGTRRRRPF